GRWRIISGTGICNQQRDTLRLRRIDLRSSGRTRPSTCDQLIGGSYKRRHSTIPSPLKGGGATALEAVTPLTSSMKGPCQWLRREYQASISGGRCCCYARTPTPSPTTSSI